jgi:hypothetical protein
MYQELVLCFFNPYLVLEIVKKTLFCCHLFAVLLPGLYHSECYYEKCINRTGSKATGRMPGRSGKDRIT